MSAERMAMMRAIKSAFLGTGSDVMEIIRRSPEAYRAHVKSRAESVYGLLSQLDDDQRDEVNRDITRGNFDKLLDAMHRHAGQGETEEIEALKAFIRDCIAELKTMIEEGGMPDESWGDMDGESEEDDYEDEDDEMFDDSGDYEGDNEEDSFWDDEDQENR